MARLRMTKAVLAERRRALATYRQALPSLRLKRQQLAFELGEARRAEARLAAALADAEADARRIPFASDTRVPIEPLLRLESVAWATEKRMGVALPTLVRADWRYQPAALETTPPWLELALDAIRALGEARLALAAAAARVAALERGLARAVQRVNLVEQRLEPEARRDIARISQLLADGERTQLARAKLARRLVRARAAARAPGPPAGAGSA